MFHVYTDGGCRGNTRGVDNVGAWAMVVYNSSEEQIGTKSAPKRKTTNNEMELTAIVEVLRWSTKKDNRPVIIYTDSAYCKNGMESWMWSWQKKGWKKGDGETPLNLELWQEAFKLTQQYINHNTNPTFVKVKGHSGIRGNEAVDNLLNVRMTELEMEDM
ncbi:ribonuclease H [Klebsiella phage vB_Kpn_3]|nr:ribonuclease H [Klebsiella phage vB_Kpn_3]